jgi:hypothetical protein
MTDHDSWYASQLDAVHQRAAADRLVSSPTGHVLASTRRLPDAPPGALTRLGLAVADAGPESAFGTGPAADRFAGGLLGLHRALLWRTEQHALRHLEPRTSGGRSLLSRQLVRGQLADAAMRLSEAEAMSSALPGMDGTARWGAYHLLASIGRSLVRLLGASGFLADGPGGDLHLAEVVGNVYLHPEAEDADV